MRKEQLITFIDNVLEQGEKLLKNDGAGGNRRELAAAWYPRVVSIFQVLGSHADPWKFAVAKCPSEQTAVSTEKLLGVIRAIREAIEQGMLIEIEEMAHADAFTGMLEHARELANEGLTAAAGTVGQTVLFEHLKERCITAACLPEGPASVAQLITALYLRGQLDKDAAQRARRWSVVGESCEQDGQSPPDVAEVVDMIAAISKFIQSRN
jgi:hypothetical protein